MIFSDIFYGDIGILITIVYSPYIQVSVNAIYSFLGYWLMNINGEYPNIITMDIAITSISMMVDASDGEWMLMDMNCQQSYTDC